MKRWFILTLIIASLAVMSVFAATPGQLLIWADSTRAPILTQLGNEFQSVYGIPVKVVEMNFGDIRTKFVTAAAAGEGPDIIVGANDWVGELAADGLLSPITFLSSDQINQFAPSSLQAFSYGGKLYGLPYGIDVLALFYNKDYVTNPPTTPDQLFTMAQQMTSGGFYGLAYPVYGNPYFSAPFIQGFGGYVFGTNPNGSLNPNDIGLANAGAVKGLDYIVSLFKAGIIPQGEDYNTAVNLFTSGKAAMMINGEWAVPQVQQAGINFGVAPIPGGEPFVGVQGFMINSKSPNQIQAIEFLSDYVNTTDTMYKIWQADPRIPARYDVAAKAEKVAPWLKGFVDALSNTTPMPNIPQMASVWNAWTNAINLAVDGKESSQAALTTAVEQIKQAIAQ
ncbi:sugar ABC transporter substrate-binding protein [Athalassotoga saccharophila]|uniref:sugar ABC transporter substrate-binding protein n=1 Tax=Athalassotoga saccharophila TaxID=1441386 RepID=UPI0013798186|nr:maltose ABC transporter substrate-binding protein [Athalassotoga saccharophila]BBJ29022.1 maltodextrin ABC transporter, substrate-binding protein MdxE [Athalassotoga saccharophila]